MAFTTTFPLAAATKVYEGIRARIAGTASPYTGWELADAAHDLLGYAGGMLRSQFDPKPAPLLVASTDLAALAGFLESQCQLVKEGKQAAIDIPPWFVELLVKAILKWMTGQ